VAKFGEQGVVDIGESRVYYTLLGDTGEHRAPALEDGKTGSHCHDSRCDGSRAPALVPGSRGLVLDPTRIRFRMSPIGETGSTLKNQSSMICHKTTSQSDERNDARTPRINLAMH